MGDYSSVAKQNAQHIDWAFQHSLLLLRENGCSITERTIRDVIPVELLQLAINVGWVPYLDENGDPYPEMLGDLEFDFYSVKPEFYESFKRLLPIDEYVNYVNSRWKEPTPAQQFQEVLDDLSWNKMTFVEHMQKANGTQYRREHRTESGKKVSNDVLIIPQDSKEYKGLSRLLTPPLPGARSNFSQSDHRKTVLHVIRQHSKKFATLEEATLIWHRIQE